MSALRFDGWVPFRLYWQESEPGVEWLYMGSHPFGDPFFETTIYFEIQTPFNSLIRFRTPLAALAEWHAASPGLEPAGFIFHLSRSGSTLITRMLAALPRNLVLSEPGVLDRMLRSHERAPQASVEQRADWVRWLVSALGQPRTGLEQCLFIKFDPRNVLDFPLLRLAFPHVPWIFVYRDPVEVMVSNARSSARFLAKGMMGPDLPGLEPRLVEDMDDQEYSARVLGMVAQTAARYIESAQGMPVEYRQLPAIVWGDLARHFGIQLTAEEIERLQQAAAFDAKEPNRRFESDTAAKNREATEPMRRMAGEWIAPHYRKLEELRRARSGGFPAFRGWLLDNPQLFDRLRGLDRESFLQTALQAASQAGIALERGDLESAIAEARAELARRLV